MSNKNNDTNNINTTNTTNTLNTTPNNPQTAVSTTQNQNQNQNQNHKNHKDYIKRMETAIKDALPTSVTTPERFTRILLSALSNNPKLAQTTPASFLNAVMTAAQLGLEPNTPLGHAYFIPRYNKTTKTYECNFQIGYKGMIELAYRSGKITTIQAHIVYENDEFTYSFGIAPELKHVPASAKTSTGRGEPEYVYGMYKTKDGDYSFEVMSMDDIRTHAKNYSDSYKSNYSPWNTKDTEFEEMAKKTVLIKLLKYAPSKSDFLAPSQSDFLQGVLQDASYGVSQVSQVSQVISQGISSDFVSSDETIEDTANNTNNINNTNNTTRTETIIDAEYTEYETI